MPDAIPPAERPDWAALVRGRLAGHEVDAAAIDDVVVEISQHLDDRYEELLAEGGTAETACAAALDELAAPHVLGRALRPVASPVRPRLVPSPLGTPPRGSWLTGVWHDVRDGLRSLRASPGLSAIALVTLAIGIGASVAIFSVVNAALLRPLPYAEPDRLVSFWGTDPKRGLDRVSFADALYAYFQARGRDVSPIAAYGETRLTVSNGTGEPERLAGTSVTPNFFATLGRTPLAGRGFRPEDAGARRTVAIIGHGLWQRRFGGDPQVVGRTLATPDGPLTIVGVMPAGFDFPKRTEVWLPLPTDPQSLDCWCYATIGRLAPGRTPADAAREIAWLTDGFWREREGKPARDPKATAPEAIVVAVPLAETLSGEVRRPLFVLLAAVGMVLLIACANIANLLLARAGARGREIAVRACVGASPWRIARQLFVESALLGLGGFIAGLALAAWATRLLGRVASERLAHVREVPLDPLVLVFAVGVALATVVLFGVAPALRGARIDPGAGAVRDGRWATRSATARRFADGFVVAQFALSLVLLVGAGLLLRSLGNLLAIDPGFRTENVLVGRLTLPWPDRPPEVNLREGRAFYAALRDRVAALPGVERFGFVSSAPFSKGDFGMTFTIKGREPGPGESALVANVRAATPGYFGAIGLPLRRGRDFTADDRNEAAPVAIVDEMLARRYWPDGDAIGQQIRLGNDGPWCTIVGVAGSLKHGDLTADAQRFVYVPQVQVPFLEMDVVVRTAGDPGSLATLIRREVRALAPGLPFYDVHTIEAAVADSLGTRQLTNRLLAAFSLAALVLAAIGIYGVMALNVTQRVQEFGVRLALGATRGAVLGLVLRQGLRLAIAGVAVGLAATVWLTRYLDTLLFGVAPLDPLVVGGVTGGLVAVALAACWLPARRATRTDPLVALRAV